MPDWASWTVDEAAKKTGYNPQYIRRLIREGKIEAIKLGSLYLIRQDSLKAFIKEIEQETDNRFGPKRRNR